jgi:hypothetical protein
VQQPPRARAWNGRRNRLCGNTTQIKVSDLEKNPEVVCPKCGLTTKIEADDLKKMRGTINQAAEKFKDALRRRSK